MCQVFVLTRSAPEITSISRYLPMFARHARTDVLRSRAAFSPVRPSPPCFTCIISSFHCYIHSISVHLNLFYPSLSPCISQHRSSASVKSTGLWPQTAFAPAIDYSRLPYLKPRLPLSFSVPAVHHTSPFTTSSSPAHIRDLLTSIINSTINCESGVPP